MSGVKHQRPSGSLLPLILIALLVTTILLWDQETIPFASTLLWAQDRFTKPSPVCNYARGRWVPDTNRPLYSGFECKRFLAKAWSCRQTNREDFSFEGYRWQPNDCEMLEFDRSSFLKRMQNKTIALVGDSLARQQFQSLMCMATGGDDSAQVIDVSEEYGLSLTPGAKRPDGWVYRFTTTNTTILYYWSATLCDLQRLNNTDPSSVVAMHLDQPPAFVRNFLDRFDVIVLNTGHHWNKGKLRANHWVMYIDGKPNENPELNDFNQAKNFTVHSIVRWLDSQIQTHQKLKAFFRTISPRHFFNGDWNTGGSCNNTVPMTRGSEVSQEGSSDQVVEDAVKGTEVKILDITAMSELRDESHMSAYGLWGFTRGYDCLHWCLPGIPDTWNEILVAQL